MKLRIEEFTHLKAYKQVQKNSEQVFQLVKLICYKIFPSVVTAHVAAVDSSDMFVLMDGEWCDACEWLLQKLDFAAHRIRPDEMVAFDSCGKLQQVFLQ